MFSIAATGIAFASWPALTASNALSGKSVVVSWSEERVQRLEGESQFSSVMRTGSFSAYISTQGRIFNRSTMTNPGARRGRGVTGSAERVGNEGNAKVSFQGNALVAVLLHEHGAMRILVTFDSGFTGCTAEVIRGKEAGANSMRANSLIRPGTRVEIQSVKTSGVTCSVRDGNVFAGG
ncbi:MAG TPA: hypothetical protein VEK75_05770 [Xanthobacteraceae bacterium]|nr:hypothetical protein [Xanthobacteraceae bacterium]